jgi:hypothetical protein
MLDSTARYNIEQLAKAAKDTLVTKDSRSPSQSNQDPPTPKPN